MKNLLLIAMAFIAYNVNAQNVTLKAIAQGPLCHGAATGSIDLFVDGGTSPYTFLWDNGATTQGIAGLVAGTYSVTVNDNAGLTSTTSIKIAEPDQLILVGSVLDVSSVGASDGAINLTVRGGTHDYFFAWDNSATSEDISGLSQGDYTVTVTDGFGCQATLTKTVNVMPPHLVGGSTSDHTSNNNGGSNHNLVAPSGNNGSNFGLSIYPNPASNQMNLKMKSTTDAQISVINSNGQVMLAQKFSTETPMVDVSTLPNGNYLVQVRTATETTTKNIVIAK